MSSKKNGGDSGSWEPGREHQGNEHFKTINGKKYRLYQSGDGDSFHYEVDGKPGDTIPGAATIEEASEMLEEKLAPKK